MKSNFVDVYNIVSSILNHHLAREFDVICNVRYMAACKVKKCYFFITRCMDRVISGICDCVCSQSKRKMT